MRPGIQSDLSLLKKKERKIAGPGGTYLIMPLHSSPGDSETLSQKSNFLKSQKISLVGENVEKRESLHTVGGHIN